MGKYVDKLGGVTWGNGYPVKFLYKCPFDYPGQSEGAGGGQNFRPLLSA
jgi:hypothetical protein